MPARHYVPSVTVVHREEAPTGVAGQRLGRIEPVRAGERRPLARRCHAQGGCQRAARAPVLLARPAPLHRAGAVGAGALLLRRLGPAAGGCRSGCRRRRAARAEPSE